MRVDVRKFLFVGILKEKDDFFKRAQEKGVIEFIDASGRGVREVPAEIQRVSHAIKVVRTLPTVEQEEIFNWRQTTTIVDGILDLQHRLEQAFEEKRVASQEMARVEVFGDFSLDDLESIREEGHRYVQFFCCSRGKIEDLTDYPEVMYVDSDHGLDYFVSVSPETRSYEGMIEIRIEQTYPQLKKRLQELDAAIHLMEGELKTYAKYEDFLHKALKKQLNEYHLESAQGLVQNVMDERLYWVEGWVAEDRLSALNELLKEFDLQCEEIAMEEGDRVPTALTNNGVARIGEDLVHIYDTPGVNDKDPSIWVLGAFSLFFAVILGDGGYGLLFLLGALFLHYRFKGASGLGKRMIHLATILSCSCILWGVLTTNFFGIKFDLNSPIRQVSLVQWLVERKVDYHAALKDDTYQSWVQRFPQAGTGVSAHEFLTKAATKKANGSWEFEALNKFSDSVMLELALLIGVLHIALSFMRNITKNWSGAGWITFMVGAYLYFPSMLNATSIIHFTFGVDAKAGAEAGLHLIYLGIGGSVVFAVIQNGLFGMLELATVIQVFSDVLSYLRLYALGLAGSMMSSTFNDIGMQMPIVAGLAVILIGHVVNIVLSIMGGVIHGLRLNFLEWYHYSFEGGGKMHEPLELLEVE